MRYSWGWWLCNGLDDDPEDFDWCEETFGIPKTGGRWFYEMQTNHFYFRNEKDAVWFEMRFCDKLRQR